MLETEKDISRRLAASRKSLIQDLTNINNDDVTYICVNRSKCQFMVILSNTSFVKEIFHFRSSFYIPLSLSHLLLFIMLGTSGYFDWVSVISESPPLNIQCVDSADAGSSFELKVETFETTVSHIISYSISEICSLMRIRLKMILEIT